ncbi:hypothetical protein FHS85_004424 [Rhodoligotrophos appendicifer]
MLRTYFALQRDGWRFQVNDETSNERFDSLEAPEQQRSWLEYEQTGEECSVLVRNEKGGWVFSWASTCCFSSC